MTISLKPHFHPPVWVPFGALVGPKSQRSRQQMRSAVVRERSLCSDPKESSSGCLSHPQWFVTIGFIRCGVYVIKTLFECSCRRMPLKRECMVISEKPVCSPSAWFKPTCVSSLRSLHPRDSSWDLPASRRNIQWSSRTLHSRTLAPIFQNVKLLGGMTVRFENEIS